MYQVTILHLEAVLVRFYFYPMGWWVGMKHKHQRTTIGQQSSHPMHETINWVGLFEPMQHLRLKL